MKNFVVKYFGFLLLFFLMFPLMVNAQQIRVYSNLVEEHEMKPNETETGEIIVENLSDQERRVVVGLENYIYEKSGEGQDKDHPRSLNDYITYTPSELRIPPNSRKAVNYQVTLPSDSKGSYWSMITIEPIMPGDRLYASADSSVVLKQRVRWGINIVATATGGEISLKHLNTKIDKRKLSVTVENNGVISIRPHFKLRLFNSEGDKVKTIAGEQHLMHPNTSVQETFDLSGVESGNYSGVIVIKDDKKTFGIRTNVKL